MVDVAANYQLFHFFEIVYGLKFRRPSRPRPGAEYVPQTASWLIVVRLSDATELSCHVFNVA